MQKQEKHKGYFKKGEKILLPAKDCPRVEAICRAEIAVHGFSFWAFHWIGGDRGLIARIFIDGPKGAPISVAELMFLNKQLRWLLSVEFPGVSVPLELSSPGLDRVLFTLEQCTAYVSSLVRVRLKESTEGASRNLQGYLKSVSDGALEIENTDGLQTILFSQCVRVQLVPVFKER
jgi:ribosome maturation factor RimP